MLSLISNDNDSPRVHANEQNFHFSTAHAQMSIMTSISWCYHMLHSFIGYSVSNIVWLIIVNETGNVQPYTQLYRLIKFKWQIPLKLTESPFCFDIFAIHIFFVSFSFIFGGWKQRAPSQLRPLPLPLPLYTLTFV